MHHLMRLAKIGVRAVSEACSRESARIGGEETQTEGCSRVGWIVGWDMDSGFLVEVWGLGLGARDDARKGRGRVSGRVRLGCGEFALV